MSNTRLAQHGSRSRVPLEIGYGALTDSIGFLFSRAQRALFVELIDTLAPLELRPAQFSVLVMIEANPDRPQSELSAALGIKKPNFVALLDQLEARGLTRRCTSSGDRRRNTLALTPAGRKLLRSAIALHSAYEARLLRRMGFGGRGQLQAILSKIL